MFPFSIKENVQCMEVFLIVLLIRIKTRVKIIKEGGNREELFIKRIN